MKSYNLYCFCVSVYNNCATFSWRLSLLMLHCRRRTKMCQSKWNVGLGTPRRCVNVRGIREWGMAAAVHAERVSKSPISPTPDPRCVVSRCHEVRLQRQHELSLMNARPVAPACVSVLRQSFACHNWPQPAYSIVKADRQ